MPTTTTGNFLFIGNFAEMDTNEFDPENENPNAVLGTHNPAIVEITQHDHDDNGILFDDDVSTGDTLTYDAGAGATTVAMDSTSVYDASVLLADGSTIMQQVVVVQAVNGDVFITALNIGALDDLDIQTISLTNPVSSNHNGISSGTSIENSSVVCFAQGTLIATPDGEVPVETLKPGDLVTTLDHGPQEITWANANTTLNPEHNAPIILPAGSLGNGLPKTPLRVSPQHRIMLRSRIANRMFGSDEVLLPAKFLQSV